MESGFQHRGTSVPTGPRWAPSKLLPSNWSTCKWNSSYKAGSGASLKLLQRARSQQELDEALEKSVSSRPQERAFATNDVDHVTPASSMSEIGSWDLQLGAATKALYNRIKDKNSRASESWFCHPDTPAPRPESTYNDMTDSKQIEKGLFEVAQKDLSTDDQRRIAYIQWLMEREKSRCSFRKFRNRGKCMTDGWQGEYWPQRYPPAPPTMPHAQEPLTREMIQSVSLPKDIGRRPRTHHAHVQPKTTIGERFPSVTRIRPGRPQSMGATRMGKNSQSMPPLAFEDCFPPMDTLTLPARGANFDQLDKAA